MILRLALTVGSIYATFKAGDLFSEMALSKRLQRQIILARVDQHIDAIAKIQATLGGTIGGESRFDTQKREELREHNEQMNELLAILGQTRRRPTLSVRSA
jgi:vacuolar-type H+-ATPase subunit I/STV1